MRVQHAIQQHQEGVQALQIAANTHASAHGRGSGDADGGPEVALVAVTHDATLMDSWC